MQSAGFVVLIALAAACDRTPTGASGGTDTDGHVALSLQEQCRDAARACASAVVAGDHETAAGCIAGEVLGAADGGVREAIAAHLAKGRTAMAAEGIFLERAEVELPRDIVTGGARLFAIVPEQVTLKVPSGHLMSHGFMLGVSRDGGASWRFVDGASFDPEDIRRMFPDLPATLVLPRHEPPLSQP